MTNESTSKPELQNQAEEAKEAKKFQLELALNLISQMLIVLVGIAALDYSNSLRVTDLRNFTEAVKTAMQYVDPVLAYRVAATALGQLGDLGSLLQIGGGASAVMGGLAIASEPFINRSYLKVAALRTTQAIYGSVGMLGILGELSDIFFKIGERNFRGSFFGDGRDIVVFLVPIIALICQEIFHFKDKMSIPNLISSTLQGTIETTLGGNMLKKQTTYKKVAQLTEALNNYLKSASQKMNADIEVKKPGITSTSS